MRQPSNYLNDGALFNHGYIDKSTRFELRSPITECDGLVLSLCDLFQRAFHFFRMSAINEGFFHFLFPYLSLRVQKRALLEMDFILLKDKLILFFHDWLHFFAKISK